MRTSLKGWNKKRLRITLVLFLLALAIPTGILIQQAYSQLKWEAFHRHRVMAEELAARIDRRLGELISTEEARSFADYGFLVVAGDPSANFLQRSPLSSYPVTADIPGLLGYFQIDSQGIFTTPLLPAPGMRTASYGVSTQNLEQRRALQTRIWKILNQNRLVQTAKGESVAAKETTEQRHSGLKKGARAIGELADEDVMLRSSAAEQTVVAQSAFDRLSERTGRETKKKSKLNRKLGRVDDLKLDYRYQAQAKNELKPNVKSKSSNLYKKQSRRKERSVLPEPRAEIAKAPREAEKDRSNIQISMFESEIDAFDFNLLDSGHFVLFRKVWRNGQRYIQGALIDPNSFTRNIIDSMFRETNLSQMSNLAVAFRGDLLEAFTTKGSRDYFSSAHEFRGELLYQTRLSAPLSDLQLIYSINRLPVGPGAKVISWTAGLLLIVLCGGFYLMYRLGVGQINLNRQQQDFVSAVSHELKTPLTSIRMYGEILREGWADEDKKKNYYAFIHDESERLSRLIANVLQLARMTRNDLEIDLQTVNVGELLDSIQSKVSSQCERAGFKLNVNNDESTLQTTIEVDTDILAQIFINLVDNAIKFAAKAEPKEIDISCRRQRNNRVVFSVRDYGAGIANGQMKKIFNLFYRSENELTRETVGTGIGLALVHQLAKLMNAEVDVVNQEPGAEFRLSFVATKL